MRAACACLLILALAGLPAAPRADVAVLSHPAAVGLDAAALREAYGLGGLTGEGVRVAVVTWGPADEAAFDAYAASNGLPPTDLAHHGDCSGPALDEWNLDVQMVKAAAPLAEIHVHCAPSATFAALRAALDEAIATGARVVSLSWGACEPRVGVETADAFARSFADASARGAAVFAASGDGGSRECTRWVPEDDQVATSWPAVDPRVVSVGGTRLARVGDAWEEEGWNACAPCPGTEWVASGGGVSHRMAAPYWQTGASLRESPDVAAVADRGLGVEVHSGGRWLAMGGTSAAAPFWAGVWAGIVGELGPLGPPGALLYHASGAHRDVTVGSNGDHAAGPGRDLVTGWGAPRGAALLDALRALPPAPPDVSSARGPGRGEVTLAWTPVPGATGYVLLRGERAGDETPIATLDDASFVDGSLGDGASAWYRVASRAAGGTGPASLPVEGRTFGIPGPPGNLTWRAQGASIVLAWDAPLDDGGLPLAYAVWRATPMGQGSFVGETGATWFRDEGCLGVCAYAVSARNPLGEGPRTPEILAPGNARL